VRCCAWLLLAQRPKGLVALSFATLLFACEAPGASTLDRSAQQASSRELSASADAGDAAALVEPSGTGAPEHDSAARTALQQHIPPGCFHAEYVISRMPSSFSDLTYPPPPVRISGQLEYCSPTRFVIQAPDHLAWRDGPTLHVLWYWKERSRREPRWYRLHGGALTLEEGPARSRPSPAHYPGRPELSYALGVEYVGDAPPAIGIFDSQLRILFGVGVSDTPALIVAGELVVDTQDGCKLHYASERAGSIWRVRNECTEEIAKFYPTFVWQAGIKDIRPIEQLTIPRATRAPRVHNHACEGAPEACDPWRPLTSAPSPAPLP
jgi:hypothetical protein